MAFAGVETLSFDQTATIAQATGTITLSDVPADATTVTIGDGIQTAVVFEFNDTEGDVTGDNTWVETTDLTTEEEAAAALRAAINASVLARYITVTAAATAVVTLTHKLYGTVGNVTITEAGDTGTLVAETGMASGVDGAVDVQFQNTHGSGDFTLTKYGDGSIGFTSARTGFTNRWHSNQGLEDLYQTLKAEFNGSTSN